MIKDIKIQIIILKEHGRPIRFNGEHVKGGNCNVVLSNLESLDSGRNYYPPKMILEIQ